MADAMPPVSVMILDDDRDAADSLAHFLSIGAGLTFE